jgi:hypothetical protein
VVSILAQRKAKSMQRAAEKIISTGEEKEIPAIKRTVWTKIKFSWSRTEVSWNEN